MTQFSRRELRLRSDGFELRLGVKPTGSSEGDTEFGADASPGTFTVWALRNVGWDRDNYPVDAYVEVALEPDEVRELLLACTVWLEAHDETS